MLFSVRVIVPSYMTRITFSLLHKTRLSLSPPKPHVPIFTATTNKFSATTTLTNTHPEHPRAKTKWPKVSAPASERRTDQSCAPESSRPSRMREPSDCPRSS